MALSLLGAAHDLPAAGPADYAVVVSKATQSDAGWGLVVDALQKKHGAKVIVYGASVQETLPGLREQFPRYACFVAQPAEVTRQYVAAIHQLTRQLDDDPYPDCFWGILTGYDAAVGAAHRERPQAADGAQGGGRHRGSPGDVRGRPVVL